MHRKELMRISLLLMTASLAFFDMACTHYAIQGTTRPGQVYVVRQSFWVSDVVYSCDARKNAPVCYRTQELERR